ncbi:MAG: phytoene/squalene synthase family protein, partial [Planctomycetota bacterium]
MFSPPEMSDTHNSSYFAAELAAWGPDARHATPTAVEAADYCRRLATSHYENFPVGSLLIPRAVRRDFYNVYAFCRWADDLGDEVDGAVESLRLLEWWEDELRACDRLSRGEPDASVRHPVFVALAETMDGRNLPLRPFLDLISAFRQDQTVTSYETFADLRDYCRRSADPVGRIVLRLVGRFDGDEYDDEAYVSHHGPDPERGPGINVARSDAVCTGLQLINFWQDVACDADIGRCYLPREDRERFGYSDADLAARVENEAFIELMRFEVARAREWLLRGLPLGRDLPGRIGIEIGVIARGGLAICDAVERSGFRVWSRRPTLTKWK